MYFEAINWLSEHLLSCPFKSCTGMDCPGCGLQRSIIKLMEGDIQGSIEMHPGGIPYLAVILITVVHIKYPFKNGSKVITWTFVFAVAVTIINYVIKIKTGNLFDSP